SERRGPPIRRQPLAVVGMASYRRPAPGRCRDLFWIGRLSDRDAAAVGLAEPSSGTRLRTCRYQYAVTRSPAAVVAQLPLVFSGHRTVCSAIGQSANLGRFDRGPLAHGRGPLGFSHSADDRQIDSLGAVLLAYIWQAWIAHAQAWQKQHVE